jgi:hypothetical protein
VTTSTAFSTGLSAGPPGVPGLRLPEYVLGQAWSRGSGNGYAGQVTGQILDQATGQPRLADSAGPGHGHQPELSQEAGYFSRLMFPPDETRQGRPSPLHACGRCPCHKSSLADTGLHLCWFGPLKKD